MKVKRIWAALLTAALMASLAVLPAGAVPSSFSDIADEETAVNADILRLMGVVSGIGDNQFYPEGTLTRAQFCTMVVNFLQRGKEAARYTSRTVFSDVGSTHWARGYVNLAAAIPVKEGEGNVPLVSGVGNGKFMPDSEITMAEAVTILLRALGYSGEHAGAVWPQGYMDLARSIDMTKGMSISPYAAITRAQAAQLFVNALKCKNASNEVYYTTLGTVGSGKSIILEVNAKTEDGTAWGAIRAVTGASSEAHLPANGSGNPLSLQGRRGELVFNSQKEIITFIPDNSSATVVILDDDARSTSIKGVGGQQYSIPKGAPVYVADPEEVSGYKESTYGEIYEDLVSGSQVTMYSENGKITTVFASIPGTVISTDAVVVRGHATAATFHQLTGGVTNFTVTKAGQPIRLSDIQEYDVVTYDKVANTLLVSDLRLTCVYADALPGTRNPETIRMLDTEFDVLPSAWESMGSYRLGDSVTLLLTTDGKVAGMAPPSGATRSTAVGVVDGGTAKIFLPNGRTLELKGKLAESSNMDGRLVIFSGGKDAINASRLSERRGPGDYQIYNKKLGSYTVANKVRIYEQISSGAMVAIDIKDLPMGVVPADRIASYHQNTSGIVDYIVLDNVTGNAYEYGMMVSNTVSNTIEGEDGEPSTTTTHTTWSLLRGTDGGFSFHETMGYSGRSGGMVGVVTKKIRDTDKPGIATVIQLTEIKNVKAEQFFESQDVQYIRVNGRNYRVADGVECCNAVNGSRYAKENWLGQTDSADRLRMIQNYSDNLTIYVDPVGEQVRIIVAN
ncbi:MAG: S-layer homology domain-containing protein [Lawsonibacter sp.]|nr:S-layer homology domain-containing protein [Lawsonibacter sp.]